MSRRAGGRKWEGGRGREREREGGGLPLKTLDVSKFWT
jgi:hypothetical protein